MKTVFPENERVQRELWARVQADNAKGIYSFKNDGGYFFFSECPSREAAIQAAEANAGQTGNYRTTSVTDCHTGETVWQTHSTN